MAFSPEKRWLFRCVALLLGLSPFILVEGVLRRTEVGRGNELVDPYVGFTEINPLFLRQDNEYRTDSTRLPYFRPESFSVDKDESEFRAFCLGGSTVQGRPFAIETAFSSWLELNLEAADPDRKWQVVNCGGISYASYRLVPILRELLAYEPDLLVVYTGHNEFLEDRTYRNAKETPRSFAQLHSWSTRFRIYNLLRSAVVEPPRSPRSLVQLSAEVDALLDYRDGLADYERDDAWRAGVIEHYRLNIERMIRIAREHDIPIVFVNPISNFRDCPPFKSTNQRSLSPEQHSQFESLWSEARRTDDLHTRMALLEQAIQIDPRYAAAHYALAKGYDQLGHYDKAGAAYIRAKEEDVCPLRMIGPLHEALREVATRMRIPLVDVRQRFVDESRNGIPGDNLLLDHVHPSINGHQMIAEMLMEEMIARRLVRPRSGWQSNLSEIYDAHLDALPAAYFVHGRQRLEGLRAWSQGRSPKEKPKPTM